MRCLYSGCTKSVVPDANGSCRPWTEHHKKCHSDVPGSAAAFIDAHARASQDPDYHWVTRARACEICNTCFSSAHADKHNKTAVHLSACAGPSILAPAQPTAPLPPPPQQPVVAVDAADPEAAGSSESGWQWHLREGAEQRRALDALSQEDVLKLATPLAHHLPYRLTVRITAALDHVLAQYLTLHGAVQTARASHHQVALSKALLECGAWY